MAINIKKILRGLGLVPKNPADSDYTPINSAGEMEVKTTDNKLNYHNGTSASPMVTEAHSATLTNKSLSDSTTAVVDSSDATKQIKFDAAGSTGTSTTILSSQTTDKTLTLPDATDTLVGKATSDVLTNKTLSGNTATNLVNGSGTLNINSSGTITVPNATDTLVGKTTSDTLTNKTLSDSTTVIADVSDNTKQIKFDAAGSAGTSTTILSSQTTNKIITLPDATDTLVGKATTDTLSNKTLVDNSTAIADASDNTKQIKFDAAGSASTSTTIASSQTANRIVTLPDATDNLVGRSTLDTLLNKTFADAITGQQISTPSSPSAGFNKLYFKSDNNLYKIDSGGNETQVGAGGGGGATTLSVTAGESLAARDAVYIASSSDTGRTAGRAYKLDVTNDQRAEFVGFSIASASAGAAATIQIAGTLTGFTGLTVGKPIFGSTTTPGSYQSSAPALSGQYVIQLGEAVSSTDIAVNAAGSATAVRIVPNTVNTAAVNVVKNYVLNGDFESNSTNSWNLLTTTLDANKIPNGSITTTAASITTFAATSSNKLAGGYSLNVASTGAISAGQGFISDPFTIDAEDKSRVLGFSFYYQVLSGLSNLNLSGTSSNSFAVYIYDVTNSAWIQPAGVYNLVQGSGVGYANGTFQTTSNSTQYRIAVVCVNITGGASSLMFDDFVVGPQKVAVGPVMSDWTAFSPSPTISGLGSGSVTVGPVASWRRTGQDLLIQFSARFSGGTGSSAVTVSIPSGLSIDTAKLRSTGGYNNLGILVIPGSATPIGYVDATSSTTLMLVKTSGASYVGSDFSSAVDVEFSARMPITGWSSNTVQSSDTDTRVVSFSGSKTSTQAVTANTTNIAFATIKDSHGVWNGSVYTVPVSGDYLVSGGSWDSASANTNTYVYVNGSQSRFLCRSASGTGTTGATLLPGLNAGDTISLRSDSSVTLQSAGNFNISRISGPAVVQASESVAMQASMSSLPSGLASGSSGTLPFNTRDTDSHSSLNTSTYIYTIPVSGTFTVYADFTVARDVGGQKVNTTYINLVKGASTLKSNRFGTGDYSNPTLSYTNKFLAGDQLKVTYYVETSSGSCSMTGGNFSVVRVGN